jgi:hypothetical protein
MKITGLCFSDDPLPGKKIFFVFFQDCPAFITKGEALIEDDPKIIG